MITHTVLFRFDEAAVAPRLADALRSLVGVVPEIRSLWAGVDSSGADDAFHLVLVTTHDGWDDLRAYGEHPDHQRVAALIAEHKVARAAVDVES